MSHPSLAALHAFRRVVEKQSFKKAADELGMTGGAVSKLVANLEEDLGVRLLHRTTRAVAVTEDGTLFYETAVRILQEMEIATEALRSNGGQPKGVLKVSVPTSFALMWLSKRLPDFVVRFPGVKLDLSLNDRFVDMVEEGYDCAVRIATDMPDSSLFARSLGKVERVLVAAPRYLRFAKPLNEPQDLVHHQCLVYSLSRTPNQWRFGQNAAQTTVDIASAHRVNNSVMLRDMLVAGCGITLTPDFVVRDLLESGQLVEALPAYRPAPHVIYGIIAHKRFVPQKVRAFLDFIASEYNG